MSNILILMGTGIFLVLIACGGQGDHHDHKTDHSKPGVEESAANTTYYYTCPMDEHKNIGSAKPGECSECGMKLVAAVDVEADSADFYGCPMYQHSHIRHEKAGKCEECSMDLKPMRLVSN